MKKFVPFIVLGIVFASNMVIGYSKVCRIEKQGMQRPNKFDYFLAQKNNKMCYVTLSSQEKTFINKHLSNLPDQMKIKQALNRIKTVSEQFERNAKNALWEISQSDANITVGQVLVGLGMRKAPKRSPQQKS